MDYRSVFTETNRRSLLSSTLAYPSRSGGAYGLAPAPAAPAPAPIMTAVSPIATRNLLLSSTMPLDQTIRIHRRDLDNSRPMHMPLKTEGLAPRIKGRKNRPWLVGPLSRDNVSSWLAFVSLLTTRPIICRTHHIKRVLGTLENASGIRPIGATIAVTHCCLYHLPFSKLEELEKSDPTLVIELYKMLSNLMARKEEITIQHLSTLHNIMSSPAHSKPVSKSLVVKATKQL